MKLQITIAGKVFEVGVDILEDELELQATPDADASDTLMTFPVPPMPGLHSDKACMSPVTGIVIRIPVTPGERVQAGDTILVLEAMKMETPVTAPRACTIQAIQVATGQAVKTGQLLVEFD